MQTSFSETDRDFVGMLSIPYETASGVVSLRFRRLDGDGKPKFLQQRDSGVWLYNTKALLGSPDLLVVCEGELDAIVCEAYAGIPAVAIAGTNGWKPEFGRCFESAGLVLVAGDGDEAGAGMVSRLCKLLPNARPAQLPVGEDINSYYMRFGSEALTDYLIGKQC